MRTGMVMVVMVLALTAPTLAAELAGVELPEQVQVGGENLTLTGMALRKVAIIKVYVAGLYLEETGQSGEEMLEADAPRHAVNHYLRGAPAERSCKRWMNNLAANTPDASDGVKADFEKLCDWMGDVEKSDRFEFSYLPATGTMLEGTNREALTLKGKAFADALFACWIGPDPGPGEKFKKDLLGQ